MKPQTEAAPPRVPPAAETRSRGFHAVLAIALALHLAMSLYAGYFNGRALWCDEILRITAQRMRVPELLRCEHNRRFCTQTTLAYLVQRPLSKLLGYELGGMAFSALGGCLLLAATALAAHRLFGRRAALLALLLGVGSPLLLYYSSELAFYMPWGGAAGATMMLLWTWCADPRPRRGLGWCAGLAAAVLGLVGLHFAGVFVWGFLFPAVGYVLWRRTPPPSRAAVMTRYALLMGLPLVLVAPMYMQAQRVQGHFGQKVTDLAKLLPGVLASGGDFLKRLLALTGGGVTLLGPVLLLGGAAVLWFGPSRRRWLAGLVAVMLVPVIVFQTYMYARGAFMAAARYYVYALAPVLMVMSVGTAYAVAPGRRLVLRVGGWLVIGVLVGVNSIECLAILTAPGRPWPYRAMQRWLATQPAPRIVVCPNQYETRFLGGHYPVPDGGTMTSPCVWEEGAAARTDGLRRIWTLVPNAVCFMADDSYLDDVRAAGVPTERRREFPFGRLQTLGWRLRLAPEFGDALPKIGYFFYRNEEDLARQSLAQQVPVSLPGAGWAWVGYRSLPAGTMRFALLKLPGRTATLKIHSPRNGEGTLDLTVFTYGTTELFAQVGGRFLRSRKVSTPPMQGVVPATRETFRGNLAPHILTSAGSQLAINLPGAVVRLDDAVFQRGWNEVTVECAPDVPLLLLAHSAVLGSASAGTPPAEGP